MTNNRPSLFKVILLTGLLVGTLDMTSACINVYLSFGMHPMPLFKYIATAIEGKPAMAGGTSEAVLGVALHYTVAYIWTILFFVLYPKVSLMQKSKVATGILYGLFMWVMMNLVIVPLTNVPKPKHFNPTQAGINAAILIVVIALPLAFIAGNYYSKRRVTR